MGTVIRSSLKANRGFTMGPYVVPFGTVLGAADGAVRPFLNGS